ncbi:MAG: metal-dependent transcriptional regulator [Phycisphaerales bacterium]|nr:metal-dependent transcriptional regulator [Planctomycetota bacterium]MBL6997714.1 metal-dependent transcriptional regulator [Phycisphaerales bacterium]
MISSTVENYLKELFLLDPRSEKQIATGELAKVLCVTPGSATSMIKTLAQSGLVEHRPHYGVKLTEQGRNLAVHVVRRHRIVELFLVNILGMDWGEVHDEAEQLEHVVSDDVITRMDELLGHPTHDPHGDPIPTPEGEIPERSLQLLSFCNEGDNVAIARIGNQDAAFLKFAEDNGLLLGASIEIKHRNDIADSITIQSQGKEVVLGLAAAGRIEVEDV